MSLFLNISGPDGVGDHRVAVKDDPSFVGHRIMSTEATSDTSYLYRAPNVCIWVLIIIVICIIILCNVFNIDRLLSLDGAILSAKISEGWRGRLGRSQTDGLHSSQIRPPNHGRHTYIPNPVRCNWGCQHVSSYLWVYTVVGYSISLSLPIILFAIESQV